MMFKLNASVSPSAVGRNASIAKKSLRIALLLPLLACGACASEAASSAGTWRVGWVQMIQPISELSAEERAKVRCTAGVSESEAPSHVAVIGVARLRSLQFVKLPIPRGTVVNSGDKVRVNMSDCAPPFAVAAR